MGLDWVNNSLGPRQPAVTSGRSAGSHKLTPSRLAGRAAPARAARESSLQGTRPGPRPINGRKRVMGQDDAEEDDLRTGQHSLSREGQRLPERCSPLFEHRELTLSPAVLGVSEAWCGVERSAGQDKPPIVPSLMVWTFHTCSHGGPHVAPSQLGRQSQSDPATVTSACSCRSSRPS